VQACRDSTGIPADKEDCGLESLERVADGLWRAQFTQTGGESTCALIDLARFRVDEPGTGVAPVACPD
jgi:hypothetical protein